MLSLQFFSPWECIMHWACPLTGSVPSGLRHSPSVLRTAFGPTPGTSRVGGTEHGATSSSKSRLSRVLTCPETLHHHSPGMNGTLGPRARWARSDRAFAAYPQSLRSFRYSTTLPAQRPYAPRRMVMQGSRGKDGRGGRVPATEQPRVLRTLESARLAAQQPKPRAKRMRDRGKGPGSV